MSEILKKAVSDEQWDNAFKSATPLNLDITLGEIVEYVKFHEKSVIITIDPNTVNLSEYKYREDSAGN